MAVNVLTDLIERILIGLCQLFALKVVQRIIACILGVDVGITVLIEIQTARAGCNALAACDNGSRIIAPHSKAVSRTITNLHLAAVKRKIHAPQGLAGGVDGTNGLAVHVDNRLAVLEVGHAVISRRALSAVSQRNVVLTVSHLGDVHRTQPACLLAVCDKNAVILQFFAGFEVHHVIFRAVFHRHTGPYTEHSNILEGALGILIIGQQLFALCVLDVHLRPCTGTALIVHDNGVLCRSLAARHLGILGIIQAQHGRDGLLVRIAVIRCKTIAADAVHHAAVVRPVHIAACPRLNVRAVRENVRHTVLYLILGILTQIAQTVQHTCRLLTGQLLLRCKFAIANAVYHAQRRTEQHILVLGIREGNRGFLYGFYVAALFPGAVNRCRQCAEIRTGDALRIRLIDLLRHNARVPRGIHRRLGPTARRFRCRSCRYQHSRR